MKFTLFLIVAMTTFLGASLPIDVQGQTKKRATPPPVTTQKATTEDGRKVVLKSNGTWQYDKETVIVADKTPVVSPPVVLPPVEQANSIVLLETGLVFKSGDVKPLARTEFHLLDDSLPNILRNAGIKPPNNLESTGDANSDYITAFAFATKYSSNSSYREFYPSALQAIKPHIVQSVTTDFGGKAKFSPVKSGTYYLIGFSATPRGVVGWNLKVDLKAGDNSVVLDQNNADIAL